jgi:hypothetical protein
MKAIAILSLFFLVNCSDSNDLLFGRVQACVAGHRVTVTDCYRLRAPTPAHESGRRFRYAPCRDAVVVIDGDSLTVNDISRGRLSPGDAIVVDHGEVLVNGKRR